MVVEEIMKEITSKLSGDYKVDILYLQKQMEVYQNHENGEEIASLCKSIIYKIIPEEIKQDMPLAEDGFHMMGILDEAEVALFKKEYKKARALLEPLAKKVDSLPDYKATDEYEYHNFNSLFEEVLYRHLFEVEKEIRQAPGPFDKLFFLYGTVLFDLGELENAAIALEKARKWNSIDTSIGLQYAETFKKQGNLEEFMNITRDVFKHADTPNKVSKCYLNYGYYFIEKELWNEATFCYLLSLQFNKGNRMAHGELAFIQERTGKEIEEVDMGALKKSAEKYNFSTWADSNLISIAFSYGQHTLENKEYETARYFLTIAYNLTKDEKIKEMLDSIPKSNK